MSFANVSHYYKAVVAFVAGLGGLWAVIASQDISTKDGLIASIVPIVTAVIVYLTKNKPAA